MGLGLGLGPTLLRVSAEAVYPAPTNQQLIATFTGVPNAAYVVMGATNARNLLRMEHTMGRQAASQIRIRDDGFRITAGTGVEQLAANAVIIARAIEKTVGGTTLATYSGASTLLMAPGASATTDPIPVTLAANEKFFTRGDRGVVDPALDSLTAIDRVAVSQQGFRTPNATQLGNTGAMNASGTSGGPSVFPTLITGIPVAPMASVVFITDSIGNGANDTNTAATGGFLAQAFNLVDGAAVPWTRQTVGGNTLNAQVNSSLGLQATMWPFVTDAFIHLGTNDLGSLSGSVGDMLLTMQTRFGQLCDNLQMVTGPYGKIIRIHASSIIRRSTFNANQEAVRVAYNQWLSEGADGYVTEYYDVVAAAGDPANFSDGIHPRPEDHVAMAAVVAPKFVPYLNPYYRT